MGFGGGRGGPLGGGGKKGNPKSSTHKGNIGAMNLLRPRTFPLESSKSHRKMLSKSVTEPGVDSHKMKSMLIWGCKP